jgi:ribonuclease VapC
MVIDTSALLAILLGEPEAERLATAIVAAGKRFIAVFSALEASVVVEARKGAVAGRELDLLIHRAGIDIVPMNSEQFELARQAFARFGKGRHPAGLNIGDCCSYALARWSGEALLFKGNDFARTDVTSVPY